RCRECSCGRPPGLCIAHPAFQWEKCSSVVSPNYLNERSFAATHGHRRSRRDDVGLDRRGRVSLSPGCHLGRERPGLELRSVFQARAEHYPAALCGSGPCHSRFYLPPRLPPEQVRKYLALPARTGRRPRRALLCLLGSRSRPPGPLRVALLRPGQDPPGSVREVGLLPPDL